jgi:hypothetical protein
MADDANAESALPVSADDSIHVEHHAPTPREDVLGGLSWMLLGLAILIGSWRMDRLTEQEINPYTIPGLVPGLLGAAMVFFSALMLFRGWRHGGFSSMGPLFRRGEHYGRLVTIVTLCVGFAAVLVGHGLPFWLAAALFVSITIIALQYKQRKAEGQLARGVVQAIVIGVGAGVIVTLVFEKFFLVRLP